MYIIAKFKRDFRIWNRKLKKIIQFFNIIVKSLQKGGEQFFTPTTGKQFLLQTSSGNMATFIAHIQRITTLNGQEYVNLERPKVPGTQGPLVIAEFVRRNKKQKRHTMLQSISTVQLCFRATHAESS